MTDKKPGNNLPRWNNYAFDCPYCHRHWEPNMIRIKRLEGTWACHRCYDQRTHRAHTSGTIVQPTPELANTHCHTCGQPFKNRRIIRNSLGQLVHYRCPRRRNPVTPT